MFIEFIENVRVVGCVSDAENKSRAEFFRNILNEAMDMISFNSDSLKILREPENEHRIAKAIASTIGRIVYNENYSIDGSLYVDDFNDDDSWWSEWSKMLNEDPVLRIALEKRGANSNEVDRLVDDVHIGKVHPKELLKYLS